MSLTSDARGTLHRGLVGEGTARFLAVSLADLAELTRTQHDLDPDAARIAAELMVCTALMSAWVKGSERITLQVQSERPAFGTVCEVDAEGGLRARFHPGVIRMSAETGIDGLMLAIKADVTRELYRGVTALQGRSLEEALRAHLIESSQVDVVLRIGIGQDPSGRVRFAGGVVVERLPDDPKLPSIEPEAFSATYSPIEAVPVEDTLTALAFGKIVDQSVEVLENRGLRWRCSCSQERIEAVIYNLGPAELRAMWAEDHGAEISCHFCNLTYRVTADRLLELIAAHDQPEA